MDLHDFAPLGRPELRLQYGLDLELGANDEILLVYEPTADDLADARLLTAMLDVFRRQILAMTIK